MGATPRRTAPILLALLLALTACSSDATDTTTVPSESDAATTTTTVPASTTTDAFSIEVPSELEGFAVADVAVGDRLLLLAIADSPELRGQGLMGVTSLGDLDGMLFYWRHEASGAFWMKDTLIPLDIVWFLADGSFAGRASMVPCTEDPCPTYSPGPGIDFRYAIEAPPGQLDWVDDSTAAMPCRIGSSPARKHSNSSCSLFST